MTEQPEETPPRIIVELKQPTPSKPSVTTFLGRLAAFGESKAGSALISFLLTAVIGTLIAGYFTELQKRRDRETADALAEQTARKEFIRFIGATIVNRRLLAGLVHSSLTRETTRNDLEARWTLYQDAYVNYNKAAFSARMALYELTGPERKVNVFADNLDKRISESFARLDGCLTRSYDQYNMTAALGPRLAAARAQTSMAQCGRMADGEFWSYQTEIDKLQRCISSFQNELEWAVKNADRSALQRTRQTRWNPWDTQATHPVKEKETLRKGEKPCFRSDYICWEKSFWMALPQKLDEGCAALDRTNYAAEIPVKAAKPPAEPSRAPASSIRR